MSHLFMLRESEARVVQFVRNDLAIVKFLDRFLSRNLLPDPDINREIKNFKH